MSEMPHSHQFTKKIDRDNYVVYDLITGRATEGKWSVAILEIHDSPKHFHRIEKEIFIVVEGILDIEINGIHHLLEAGDLVEICPGTVHQLRSANGNPVRVLCINFPAFDPADMYDAA